MEIEPERRLIGYARVSTDDQDLTLQRKALVGYGVQPEHIFEEHASGGRMDRPALRRALRSMRGGDTIVVWKLDRLGRTLTGVIEAVEEMTQEGVNLVSLTEKIDTTSAMGRAFFQIALVFAELERALISERTKAALAQKRANGETYSPTPYGFQVKAGRLEQDRGEAAVVSRILKHRKRGKSYTAIADHLNRQGIPTKQGRQWYASTVHYICKRQAA